MAPAPIHEVETLSASRMFGGTVQFLRHSSNVCNGPMMFSVFLPPAVEAAPCPVLWWLSGLTCTPENVMVKSGVQRFAAEHGIVVVAPDTSPRGEDVPDDDAYDLGCGAGFYLNATQAPWATHYRMYDYVVQELPEVIGQTLPVDMSRQGIFGHSMGGHGALTIALTNPGRFRSVSAFAPISSPSQVPWGRKAFAAYLGPDATTWAPYDATALVGQSDEKLPILIDQGDSDACLDEQLRPWLFQEACKQADYPLQLRMQSGYDHGYYFVASFIGDHVAYHAKALA